jgi:phasin family protein
MTTKSTKSTSTKGPFAVEDAVAASQEAIQNFLKAGTEGYEKAFGTTRAKMEEVVKNYDQFAVNGKENVDAVMAASNACTKGVEAINAEMMAFAKQAMEDNMTAAKAVMGAKTLQEMIELQTQFAKASFDGFMTQSTKVGELATKVAQETTEPLNERFTSVMEKWTHIAA